jgi:uncharacterized protein
MAGVSELVETPRGPARVHADLPAGVPRALLALGHGAGGGVSAPDLVAVTETALGLGLAVVRVEQPYRVAGRRAAAPAPQLDEAWRAVLAAVTIPGVTLIVGGRSSGARVACRTAADVGAAAVLCLAFPVHPPGRPEKSRLPELDGVPVPALCVAGSRDPFGVPPDRPGRDVVIIEGADHALRKDVATTRTAVTDWLTRLGITGE